MMHTPTLEPIDMKWRIVKWDSRRWAVMAGSLKLALVDNKYVAEQIRTRNNFFHGHDIETDKIPEGGFWEMANMLSELCEHGMVAAPGPHFRWDDEYYELFEKARVLLSKLGVEK